jgi:DNA primase
MIPDEIIEQIRDAADIVGLIGETTELKRTGSDYRGACPFHGGTHRNFAVIPKKGRFYCFVCKESGDVFSYLMKRFGMDYPTAVREVAGRTGIVIPDRPSRQGPDPREPLFSALSVAHEWFRRQLMESAEAQTAREYLAGRDLDLETVAPFELGYAPRGNALQAELGRLGIGEGTMLEVGLLARRDDGTIHSKFRGRLLFPIHDPRGRVCGFGGRLLGPGEPKYLNSPETALFHKGTMLYNLHQARNAIRKEASVILVEGYFDVLRLVLAGLEHVVAPLGTALTADQAALLRRLAPSATLLLDSDAAGLKATFRAADVLLAHEVRVRVATMPPGEDPDSLVRAGGLAALEPVLKDAIDVLERKIQILERKGWFADVEHRREALDRLLPTVRAAKDPITRELYLSLVAERAGVDKKVLEKEVDSAPPAPHLSAATTRMAAQAGLGAPRPAAAPGRRRDGAGAERQLLSVLLSSPDGLVQARETVSETWFEVTAYRAIYSLLLAHGVDPGMIAEHLPEGSQALWTDLLRRAGELAGQQVDQIYVGACQLLEARPHLRAYDELMERLRAAPPAEQAALADEKQRHMDELKRRFPDAWQRHNVRSRANLAATRRPSP